MAAGSACGGNIDLDYIMTMASPAEVGELLYGGRFIGSTSFFYIFFSVAV